MSTAASNGKTAQSAALAGRVNPGSVDKPASKPGAKAKPKSMTPEQRKQVTVIGIAVAVVLAMGAVIFAYFHKPETNNEHRLNGKLPSIIAYVSSNEFDKLDFERKKLYWKELSGKKKEIEELHKSGQINDAQLKEVLSIMWIGKQFKHIEKYNSLGDIDRKAYLDKIIDEDKIEGSKPKGTITKDDKRIRAIIETFPEQERLEIERFRQAIKDREKERKAEDRAIKKNAATQSATSRPTSRPTERPAGAGTGAKPAIVPPK